MAKGGREGSRSGVTGRLSDVTRGWVGRDVRAGMLFRNLNVMKLDYGIGLVLTAIRIRQSERRNASSAHHILT